MTQPFDQSMIQRAIDLAMHGRGHTEPNPSVGCVIVKAGRIIGQGYTQPFGGPHAEPTALASCTESPEGATAYVTLEPCCHKEKKTPPCVPKLIEAKIARVVLGCLDPNPKVNGQGIAQLRQAGIEVVTGVLEPDCKQLIAPFIATTQHHRPYITLKWAQTADGKVAGAGGTPIQITNEKSRQIVHALRSRCDAIVVGINTVLTDDPLLTVRHTPIIRPLTRYILDRQLRTPPESRLMQSIANALAPSPGTPGGGRGGGRLRLGISPIVIATDPSQLNSHRASKIRSLGVEIIPASTFQEVLQDWHHRCFTHVLIEPGPTLAKSIMNENLADRIWLFRSSKAIHEPTAPSAPLVPDHFHPVGEHCQGHDRLTELLNTKSPVYFASKPSGDFHQIR